jgi:hypothetical protein
MRLYKLIFFIAAFYIINICNPALSFACQPCRAKLNFKDTVQRADLIIIGKKIASEGRMLKIGQDKFYPEGGRIKISRVLKGQTGKSTINVRCLSGMCGYGICLNDDKPYVIFLSAAKSDGSGFDYTSVNSGCAVRYYKVAGDSVVMDGVSVPVSQLEKMISGK